MNDRMPRISIGVPLFNAERYLPECLESIARQSFKDFEVIISDNASTDGTRGLCEEIVRKDHRFHYHRNGENLGAAKNFNRVFELSGGEFFRWAAYDDLMGPRALEVCLAALLQNPDAVLAYPKSVIIDEHGAEIEKYDDEYALGESGSAERFKHFLRVVDRRNCHPIFGLMRRQALALTPLLGNYHSADKVLLAQLAMLGKFVEVPEYQFYRRYHPLGSIRANRRAKDLAAWFDTSKRGSAGLPRLRRAVELVKTIHDAPISMPARVACGLHLIRFFMKRERWIRLVGLRTQF